jgi:hypothetical protein
MMLDTIQTTLKLAIWALLDVVKRYGIDANKALCRVDISFLGDSGSSSGNSGHSCYSASITYGGINFSTKAPICLSLNH